MCLICWLKMMARYALWVLKFWESLRAVCARTALAVREWSPQ